MVTFSRLIALTGFLLTGLATGPVEAERETVLKQIDLPHNYYYREMYLPQLTSGPSSMAWSPDGRHELDFSGFMHSIIPVDHLEVVVNGKVVQTLPTGDSRDSSVFEGTVTLDESGWVLLRAWNDDPSPWVFDLFPYATTNPVFVQVGGQPVRSAGDADYFLRWIARLRESAENHTDYNIAEEKQAVLSSIDAAADVFETRR